MSSDSQPQRTISCLLFEDDHVRALESMLLLIRRYLQPGWTVEAGTAATEAQVVLVNADHPDATALLGSLSHLPQVVGASTRPRDHAPGTLHRPFKPYEMMATLKEAERRFAPHGDADGVQPQASAPAAAPSPAPARPSFSFAQAFRRNAPEPTPPPAPAAPVAGRSTSGGALLQGDTSRSYKLHAWPTEFLDWPRDWWRILAILRVQQRSLPELVAMTGIDATVVAACVETLLEYRVVEMKLDPTALVEVPPPPKPSAWSRIGSRVADLLRRR